MKSLTINTFANYASLIYVTLIGVIMLGQYLQFLGEEAYGLVGFFTLMQTWLSLLTTGIGPTLSRQVAQYKGRKELWKSSFKKMLRSVEIIVIVLAILTIFLVWTSRHWIATEWLDVKEIPTNIVTFSIALMGIITALRWNITLYTSGIAGMEYQVWLAGFNTLMATLRYGAGYIQLRLFSTNIADFFLLQLVLTILELVVALKFFYGSQPKENSAQDPGLVFSRKEMQELGPFLLSIGYTSAIWTLLTQTDKLILSHALPLKEFGYLTIVTLIANGILRFSEPVSQAILPRMALYQAQGNTESLIKLYKNTTQFIAVVAFTIVGVAIIYSEPLIYILTNKLDAAVWGAPVLMWFTIGNGILVVAGMQYALQFTYGNLRLHVINSTINIFLQIPLIAYAAFMHGALGVAITWAVLRLILFLIYPAIVHRRLVPGMHLKWLLIDIGLPLCGVGCGVIIIQLLPSISLTSLHTSSKPQIILTILSSSLIIFFSGLSAAPSIRNKILAIIRKH